MNIPEECDSTKNSYEIKCEENDSEIIFINRSMEDVRVIEVDDCVINDQMRCDWLVIDESEKEHFVELKSKTNVKKGIDQLSNTIRLMCAYLRNPDRLSFLVHKKSPRVSGALQIRITNFEDEFNSPLYVRKSPHTHEL